MALSIDYVPLAQLVPADSNPKLHAFDQLEASVRRFGFVQPLLLNEADGKLVAGHGRMETLQRFQAAGGEAPEGIRVTADGAWLVPVIRGVAFKNADEARAYLLADNRLAEMGGWDDAQLAEMLRGLEQVDGLAGVGFSVQEVERLLKSSDPGTQAATGMSPEEKFQGFQNAEIKQVVLYFDGAEYDSVLGRLRAIQEAEKLQTNTDVVLRLLELYEKQKPPT